MSVVPSLEVCKRLAKAGWSQENPRFFYINRPLQDYEDDCMRGALCDIVSECGPSYVPSEGDVAAPTIDELLAYIRERGWRVEIANLGDEWSVVIRHGLRSSGNNLFAPKPVADALGLILSRWPTL